MWSKTRKQLEDLICVALKKEVNLSGNFVLAIHSLTKDKK